MSGIHLKWEGFSQSDWEKHLNQISRSNSFHDWDFANLISKHQKSTIERALIFRDQDVIGLVQTYLNKHLCLFNHRKTIRGPIFLSPPMPDELENCFKQIKARSKIYKGQFSSLVPELPDSDAVTKGLSKMGLNKIITGYSSIWIDLRNNEDKLRKAIHSKWRNQLSKSETQNLHLHENNTLHMDWLLASSLEHQSEKGFTAITPAIYGELPASKKLCLSITQDEELVAAALFQLHGQSATYEISHVTDQGKKSNATNFLLWNGIISLKSKGFKNLDLGGIDEVKNPGLARFKERMGGESFTLTGTYI